MLVQSIPGNMVSRGAPLSVGAIRSEVYEGGDTAVEYSYACRFQGADPAQKMVYIDLTLSSSDPSSPLIFSSYSGAALLEIVIVSDWNSTY